MEIVLGGVFIVVVAFLRGAGMLQVSRWALLVPSLGLVILVGCRSGAPYSWDELARIDRYVDSVEYLPRLEVDQRCDGWRLNGCAYLTDGRIYIVNHDSVALRECILQHELSHFYDVYILGRTLEQTRRHEGWLAKYCYPPPVHSQQPDLEHPASPISSRPPAPQ